MKEIHTLLTKLTERFPPALGSGGHKVALGESGNLTLTIFQDKVWEYKFDEEDLNRPVEDLLRDVITMHQLALDEDAV